MSVARGAAVCTVRVISSASTVNTASWTLPATVLAVWLPWPLTSRAVGEAGWKFQAPISLSLQMSSCWGWDGSHTPTYVPLPYGLVWVYPSASVAANDGWPGFTPVSSTPTTMPSPRVPTPAPVPPVQIAAELINPWLVSVSSSRTTSRWTATTP